MDTQQEHEILRNEIQEKETNSMQGTGAEFDSKLLN